MIKYYNIHDLVYIKVVSELPFLQKYTSSFFKQFSNFEASDLSAPDIIVNLKHEVLPAQGCRIYDDKIYIKDNYIFWTGERKLSTWSAELTEEDGCLFLSIATNLVASISVAYFITEFLIHFVLTRKGASLVHAAGLEKNGEALLLAGASGGGKTTISMSLIDEGYKFLGDNYIILFRGVAYSYPSPLNIFYYNLVPFIRERLTRSQKLGLALRGLVIKATGGYLKAFMKVNPHQITEGGCDCARCSSVIFLVPAYDQPLSSCSVFREFAVKRLVANMMLEWEDLEIILHTFAYTDNELFKDFWVQCESVLSKNLENLNSFCEIKVPTSYADAERAAVIGLVKKMQIYDEY